MRLVMVGLPYGQTNDKSLLGGKKMKRNNKLLTSIICLIIAFACIVCLASCGGGDEGGTGDGNCSHTYGEWTTTEEASCENDGEMQRSCTKCGETKTKTLAAPLNENPSRGSAARLSPLFHLHSTPLSPMRADFFWSFSSSRHGRDRPSGDLLRRKVLIEGMDGTMAASST